MGKMWSQLFPPTAKFTEKTLPDQTGKVFIITGASSGVGKELAQILYSHNATVYIAARSSEKASKAISQISTSFPESKGTLVYLHLDLNDLSTIKASASEFLAKETRLDVLWNNAGVMIPPQGSKTKQGYELQLGTNCVAPFLFTKLLLPALQRTAKDAEPGSVRVVWVASSAADHFSPKGAVAMDNLDYKVDKKPWEKYGVSKAGNILYAKEFERRYAADGIISVSLDPGNLKTDLQRHLPGWQSRLLNLSLHPAIYGAYTELFAGLSPDVRTGNKRDNWIAPWGRFVKLRGDIEASVKGKEEGGTGVAGAFWEWTEEQVKAFV